MKDGMLLGAAINSLLLSSLEQAKNVTSDETVVATKVTSCGHKPTGLVAIQKLCFIWYIFNFNWEH